MRNLVYVPISYSRVVHGDLTEKRIELEEERNILQKAVSALIFEEHARKSIVPPRWESCFHLIYFIAIILKHRETYTKGVLYQDIMNFKKHFFQDEYAPISS